MKFLRNIRARIGYSLLCRKVKKMQRARVFNNLETAGTVGVVFDMGSQDDCESVAGLLQALRARGKQAEAAGILPLGAAAPNPAAGVTAISQDRLTMWCYPSGPGALQFAGKDFDLLINLCPHESLALDYLMGMSKARFKVSPQLSSNDFADFILRLSSASGQGAAQILSKLEEYLNAMSKS